jgi:hypothetical protein
MLDALDRKYLGSVSDGLMMLRDRFLNRPGVAERLARKLAGKDAPTIRSALEKLLAASSSKVAMGVLGLEELLQCPTCAEHTEFCEECGGCLFCNHKGHGELGN